MLTFVQKIGLWNKKLWKHNFIKYFLFIVSLMVNVKLNDKALMGNIWKVLQLNDNYFICGRDKEMND